jgi:hypothetical protein
MNVTIVSCFRNATGYIPRYFDQVGALAKALAARGDWLKLILGYGDSTDGTGEMLFEEAQFSLDALLVDCSHGGREFGSIENPQRFKQLAYVGNKLLDCVPPQADVVGIVESDLIWDAATLVRLIDHLAEVPAVAPMIMDGPNSFYDVFAFRRDGVRFTKTSPYYPGLNGQLFQVDSAGSVLFVRGELARKARLTDGEAIIGWCRQINEYGGSIWLDPTQAVEHP